MPNEKRVLILGGTGDAFSLAKLLDESGGFDIISSLAGRTRYPVEPPGQVRSGGFGGVAGLVDFLKSASIEAVVDATHPYAARISGNAAKACNASNIPHVQLLRPAWQEKPEDHWVPVETLRNAAAEILKRGFQRIFLTTGRQELKPFTPIKDRWFLLRMIDPPKNSLGFEQSEIILGRGPFDTDAEVELMKTHRIDAIVTKNSGGTATYGKVEAAQRLKLPVIVIQRPSAAEGNSVTTADQAVKWLKQLI